MNKIAIVLSALVAIIAAAAVPVDEPVAIVKQEQDASPEGNFKTEYETANGITFQEQGTIKNAGGKDEALSVEGSYGYSSPDGTPIQLTYVADENGFQPQGAHLPVPPPTQEIPAAIARALEYIRTHPDPEAQKYV